VNGFLRPTLTRTYNALKFGGVFLINISNCKLFSDKGYDLESETLRIAKELGAEHEATLTLLKSKFAEGESVTGDHNAPEIMSGEPIFVFRKRERRELPLKIIM
jgi:hypothetical protein